MSEFVTHLTKHVHASPVDVSHGAAVNDDVMDVCVCICQAAVLFLSVTVHAHNGFILEQVGSVF